MELKIGISGILVVFMMIMGVICPCSGQSIPPRPDGFPYRANSDSTPASVAIEAFFDPTCPDSRDAWPPLKKVLHHYGPRTHLVVHAFPLPYHDNAFAASRALHIVNELNSSDTYHLLEEFFKNQEQFYSAATKRLNRVEAVDKIQKFVMAAVGGKYKSAIKSGFNDTKTDYATRYGFKTGGARGVYGTPFFFVNGFPLPNAGSGLDYKGWRKVIDPLVKDEPEKKKKNKFLAGVHY